MLEGLIVVLYVIGKVNKFVDNLCVYILLFRKISLLFIYWGFLKFGLVILVCFLYFVVWLIKCIFKLIIIVSW